MFHNKQKAKQNNHTFSVSVMRLLKLNPLKMGGAHSKWVEPTQNEWSPLKFRFSSTHGQNNRALTQLCDQSTQEGNIGFEI